MADTKRTTTELARDRALIARLHYQGWTDAEIAQHLNERPQVGYEISRRQVTYDRQQMVKRWQVKQEEHTERWIAESVAELQAVRMAAWAAYEKSLGEQEKKTITERVDEDGVLSVAEIKTQLENNVGDTNQLQVIMKATEQINRLRGLYEMKLRIDQRVQQETVVKHYVEGFSPSMWGNDSIQVIDGEVLGIEDGENAG